MSDQPGSDPIFGLYALNLQAVSPAIIGPLLTLRLLVDAPHDLVTGIATVFMQGEREPDGHQTMLSHITGTLIPETVMPPGQSHTLLTLTGFPQIALPGQGGPAVRPNFKARILLPVGPGEGLAWYEFRFPGNGWQGAEQRISRLG